MAHDETFELDDGTVTDNRSAYIRQEFNKDRSRGDIAEELDVSYNIVYTATANMENATTGKRGRKTITDPELCQELGIEEGTPRNEFIKEKAEEGNSRREIADMLGISYNVVYAATSDMDVATSKGRLATIDDEELCAELGIEPGTIRKEFIKEKYAEDNSRREIADMLGVDYAVAWQATKDMDVDEDIEDEQEEEEEDVQEDIEE